MLAPKSSILEIMIIMTILFTVDSIYALQGGRPLLGGHENCNEEFENIPCWLEHV